MSFLILYFLTMLALLPLDNRPCNLRFPRQIAAMGGEQLVTPPSELLGRFNTPGNADLLAEWLRGLPEVCALIVSVDMLAYGGLVASRRTRTNEQEALQRLEVLREFRRQRPQTPLLAFNILMRLAITMDGDEAVANYYNVMRYARLCDEAERFDSDHLRDEKRKVEAQIPPSVLQEYLGARARNHSVNLKMINWLSEGIFDFLLITQEDATEFGLHRREQDEILERAAQTGTQAKMSLHPGADEAALTLLARFWETGARFRVHWSNAGDAHRIAPFEDRPFDVALHQHVEAVCGKIVEDDAAEFELFVNAPVGGSQKDESDGDRTARAMRLLPFARAIVEEVNAGRQVALCDVAFPNGADNVLLTELDKRGVLGKLAAFGGWNTAGNTTGTVLAHCVALKKAQANSSAKAQANLSALELSRRFVFERLVDDWFYQSRVRARIEKSAREQGLSPFNMEDAYEPIEGQARRELRGFAQILAGRQFHSHLDRCEIYLPWGRTFEADVRARLSEKPSANGASHSASRERAAATKA